MEENPCPPPPPPPCNRRVKIYSCLCLPAYNSVTKSHAAKNQNSVMNLPFVNLGSKFQPHSFEAHRVETLYSQHTLARLLLILPKPRLSRLSTLPCYVLRITDETRQSFIFTLKSTSNLKERLRHKMDKRKSFAFPRQYRDCFSRRINPLLLRN